MDFCYILDLIHLGREKAIELLIKYGEDVNAKTQKFGNTPIFRVGGNIFLNIQTNNNSTNDYFINELTHISKRSKPPYHIIGRYSRTESC